MIKPISAYFTHFLMIAVLLAGAASAQAALIRVSQESSAGAGDFDANILGVIDSYSTTLTITAFYQYSTPNAASYNGELNGGPVPISSTTQSFFVEASNGLALVMVHDNPNDGSGGSTRTRWNLLGDTAVQVVADDPGEPVIVSAGGTQFDSTKNWAPCCTDGYAIGFLDGDWSLFGQFLTTPTGITSWLAEGFTTADIPLVLEPSRRVRFDIGRVPEPSIIALFGTGLLALAFTRRRYIRCKSP